MIDFDDNRDKEFERLRILYILKHRGLATFDGKSWELTYKGKEEYNKIVQARIDKRILNRRPKDYFDQQRLKLEIYMDIKSKASNELEYMVFCYKHFISA